MENNQNKNPETPIEHLMLLENAIDLAVSKGVYNKIDVIKVTQSIFALSKFIQEHTPKESIAE